MEKNNLKKRILAVVLAIFFIGVGFLFGFLTGEWTKSSTVTSYSWAIQTIKNYYYKDISDEDLLNYSLKGLTGNIIDIYSTYYTAEEYQSLLASATGSYVGIGISTAYVDNSLGKGLLVERVEGNSPAYYSGLKKGEIITGIKYNGQTHNFTSYSTFNSFVRAIDENVEFTLITDKGEHDVSRQAYTASYCYMATNTYMWDCTYTDSSTLKVTQHDDDGAISYLPDGMAYIGFSQFNANAAYEMAALLKEFNAEGYTTLILDLRDNGGGYVSIMQQMAYLFTNNFNPSSDVAMTAKYKDGTVETYKINNFTAQDSCISGNADIYVMTNSGTASASEALLGVLISYGVISYDHVFISQYGDEYMSYYGSSAKNGTTYGKGIMQSTFTNAITGEAMKLTTAEIFWPNEKSIHGVGLTESDGCKLLNAVWDVTYNDEELQSAISYIKFTNSRGSN